MEAASAVQLPTVVFTGSSKQTSLSQSLHHLTCLRPSTNRISAWGSRGINPGRESILGTPGPMTVERDALELFMQVAVGAQPWKYDPAAIVKDWTPYKFTRPLKIAVQWWDGVVMPHPPMIRALKEVVEACRKAGHEIVEWDSESLDHKEAWDILSALYWPDGGKQMMGLLEQGGEEPLPLTKFIVDEQPTVKELTQNELWEVGYLPRTIHPPDAESGLTIAVVHSKRPVPRQVRPSVDKDGRG